MRGGAITAMGAPAGVDVVEYADLTPQAFWERYVSARKPVSVLAVLRARGRVARQEHSLLAGGAHLLLKPAHSPCAHPNRS